MVPGVDEVMRQESQNFSFGTEKTDREAGVRRGKQRGWRGKMAAAAGGSLALGLQ
jgi:hypothetical protein